MSAKDLAISYILAGIENSTLMGIRYLGVALITAATVLLGVWLLAISLPSPAISAGSLHWLRELFFLFLPWPLTILIGLWIVARSESFFWLILGVTGSLRRIKLFGAEVELNEQTKRKIQSAASEIDTALGEYKGRVDKEVARIVARYQLEQALSNFIESDEVKSFAAERSRTFRCTVYIPDPIRYGRLYQMIDYCPSGEGRARTFSARYGIIGRVWRTEVSTQEGDLLPPVARGETRTHEQEVDAVMSNWGMNRREAESALKHRSYFCCPLIHENSKVGLLYMDSTEKNAFNEGSQMAVLEKAMSVLAPLVSKTLDDLSAIALQIEVE
jgi:hypothetical protein